MSKRQKKNFLALYLEELDLWVRHDIVADGWWITAPSGFAATLGLTAAAYGG